MSRWPLLWQIVFRNMLATLAVCIAFGIIAYAALFRYMLASMDSELLSEALEARQILQEAGGPPIFTDTPDGREEDAGLAAENMYVSIYSADGRLLDCSTNARSLALSPPRWMMEYAHGGQPVFGTVSAIDGRRMRAVLFPVLEAGRLSLLIFCTQSVVPVERALESFVRGILAIAPVMILIALTISWVSARSSLEPFKHLAKDLSGITASSLTKPLPLRGTGDELDQVVAAFNDLMARLAEAFEHLQQFANQAAHQLRTPLTVLRGEIELALERAQSAEDYKRALKRAAGEVSRLEKLVNSLLLLSKLERRQLPGELVELDVVLREVAHAAADGRCHLEVSIPPEPLVVVADPQLLEQMLFNILDNACRYGRGQVEVRAWRRDQQVVVEIADDGPGMSPDELRRVGTPFFRGSAAEGTDGSGLGLAVSIRIAEAFGGAISFECPDTGGTVVTITLPAAKATDE